MLRSPREYGRGTSETRHQEAQPVVSVDNRSGPVSARPPGSWPSNAGESPAIGEISTRRKNSNFILVRPARHSSSGKKLFRAGTDRSSRGRVSDRLAESKPGCRPVRQALGHHTRAKVRRPVKISSFGKFRKSPSFDRLDTPLAGKSSFAPEKRFEFRSPGRTGSRAVLPAPGALEPGGRPAERVGRKITKKCEITAYYDSIGRISIGKQLWRRENVGSPRI